MRKAYIKHDNLRKIIEKLYVDEDINENDVIKLENELKHSCLIIAADKLSNNMKFRALEYKNKNYGLLFTDMDEFRKAISNDEVESHYFPFEIYKEIIQMELLDGFVLNIETESFILEKEIFHDMDSMPQQSYPNDNCYTASQLKDLKDSINNEELENFIKNTANLGKYDELFEKIASSTMMTLMVSPEDLDEYAEDGVISMEKTGPLGFLYIDEIGGDYATIYTSQDKISKIDTPYNKYSQLVNFSSMVNFILNDDMDGIIINPRSENIILSRDVLLEYSSHLQKTCNDSRLNNAIFHMFKI